MVQKKPQHILLIRLTVVFVVCPSGYDFGSAPNSILQLLLFDKIKNKIKKPIFYLANQPFHETDRCCIAMLN